MGARDLDSLEVESLRVVDVYVVLPRLCVQAMSYWRNYVVLAPIQRTCLKLFEYICITDEGFL